ncbi:uncharacterized protein ELE39_002599 [Cryptosporidium sp. chipmunk genotype I]|uniref:uncharacterized protein n=1 Tax=Cryptosporidium sp. chipmunk genotype I TaxID=1280935 RepID=UPI003519FDD5|nr:hypothetical protein ELE39_002599 [Cryptosporidium sp. chipmunk genotype I]
MNPNKKSESKRKRRYKRALLGYEINSDKVNSDEYIHKILDELSRKIPEITFDLTKIYNGVNSKEYGFFNKILVHLDELLGIFNSPIIFTEETNYFAAFNKMEKVFESVIIWLSVNNSKILITIIYSIPLIINILIKLKHQCINIQGKKRLCIEYSQLNIIVQKFMKKAIQIFSCLSVSTEARVRVACVYCTTLIAKLEEFEMSIIEDALSTPISPVNYIDSKTKDYLLMQGDTTSPELFVASISKFYEANLKQSFTHSFSVLNYGRISNNCGSNNDLFDKGWLSRRLDDESPAVRFEIFMLIYELLKTGKINNSEFLKSITEIAYDCFLDENIAIQSLVSEIITILSEVSPISINNVNKVLPIINDSNIYTRYNILKVISNSYFEDVEALHIALTAVLDSPLLHFDEKLVFNVFSSTAIKNSTFAPEIIPILFEQYYIKEEEIYHASISIFLFWAIWKTPSIVKKINFDLLLLYPEAKFNFSSNIPDLRIRVSNENASSFDFEVKPQLYNSNVLNYSLGLYPMKLKNKHMNTNSFKKGLFVSIGNAYSDDFLNSSTTMEMCLSGNSPIESLFEFSLSYFTSISYVTMKRKSFFNQLETLNSYLKTKKDSPRINTLFNISSILFLLRGKFFINTNLMKSDVNFGAKPKEFGILNSSISHSLWPVNSKFNSELCRIFDSKVLKCSSFIISTPDICGSISFSYFFENYIPKKKKHEKLCLLLGNLSDELTEFRSLFCQCIICKFNTYYQESHPEYLDGSSKVVFSKIKDIILKKTKIKFYSFPFKVLQKIPVGISFDVNSSINNEEKSIDQSINLFIQTPQALKFKNPKVDQFFANNNRRLLINGSHNVLNEVDSINFESYNTANVYCQINSSAPFTVIHSRRDDPIINSTIPLKVCNRQSYVFPIAKDMLRMSITDLIQIKFEYPIASPVTMNAVVVNKKSCLASPISNVHSIIIHPNIMA